MCLVSDGVRRVGELRRKHQSEVPTRFSSWHFLITNRQRELKDGAPGRICFRPKTSSVSFDNRTADGQSHAQALRLRRIKGVEKTVETPGSSPGPESLAAINTFRSASAKALSSKLVLGRFTSDPGNFVRTYLEFSRTLAHSIHGFDGID
jgi:hypothetical protein